MKKIRAFTFIELLVVTSILIITASTTVFYFFGFLDQVRLNTGVDLIKQQFLGLDKQVKNKKILDYKLFLKKDSLLMYYYSNTLNIDNLLEFTGAIDYYTGTGKLELYPLGDSGNALKINLYVDKKFLKDYLISGDKFIIYGFSKFKSYQISGTYSGQILNNINLNYFSEDNLDHKKQNYLKLIKIKTDKTNNLDSVFIKNVLGRKSFSDNLNSTKLYLTFDINGKEKTLIINK